MARPGRLAKCDRVIELVQRHEDPVLPTSPRTGNPSTQFLPGWPEYRADQRHTILFGPDVKTLREDREPERAIWTTDLLE